MSQRDKQYEFVCLAEFVYLLFKQRIGQKSFDIFGFHYYVILCF